MRRGRIQILTAIVLFGAAIALTNCRSTTGFGPYGKGGRQANRGAEHSSPIEGSTGESTKERSGDGSDNALLVIGPEQRKEINALVARMSVEELAGQLIVPVVYPSTNAQRIREAQNIVRQIGAGGILFQKGDPYAQREMTRQLNDVSTLPLLITADAEWGLAMRLSSTIRYPRNSGLANCSPELITLMGGDLAAQCRTMGIHVNFAPVADINNNPHNPVIGTRSFGTTSSEVTRCVLAFSKGMEDGGVLTVAKHFPGHGNTNRDSHKTLPTIKGSLSSIRKNELIPFKAYIDAGFGGIMTAHLSVPALDPTKTPASLSRPITTDLLQNTLGFKGLIFTDGLQMAGAQQKGTYPLGVAALLAGNDMLLGPTNPVQMHRDIVRAVAQGTLTRTLLEQRVTKVLEAKYAAMGTLSIKKQPVLSRNELLAELNCEEFCAHADRIWYESLRVSTSKDDLLPLSPKQRIGLLEIGNVGGANGTFQKALAELGVRPQIALTTGGGAERSQIVNSFKGCDIVLINSYSGRSDATLTKALASKYTVIYAHFASPYGFNEHKVGAQHAAAVIQCYEVCAEAQRAYAALLYPEAAFGSKANFRIVRPEGRGAKRKEAAKPLPKTFFDANRFAKVDEIATKGLRMNAYPGCQIVVLHKGKPLLQKAYGTLEGTKGSESVTLGTVYDVASVTKMAATIPAIMILTDRGLVKPNRRVADYIPELQGSPVGKLTVKELLQHKSGLPAGINFFNTLIDPASLQGAPLFSYRERTGWTQIDRNVWVNPSYRFNRLLVHKKEGKSYDLRFGEGYFLHHSLQDSVLSQIGRTNLSRRGSFRYSDVGYILLGMIVERASGKPLDLFIEEELYKPMGLEHCRFKPMEKNEEMSIAPTQKNCYLRGKLQGTVDDESAAVLGGVAGNAGLFSSAVELAAIGELLLNEGTYGGKQLIKPSTVRHFTKGMHKKEPRTEGGFMKWYPNNPNLPSEASQHTYGHTGFTGTALWIDPDNQLVFVFLCNRTYPTRMNKVLNTERIRPALLEAVYQAL